MQLSKRELLTIWRAISALETAYMVTLSQENKADGFGYWERVSEAQDILEKAILEEN